MPPTNSMTADGTVDQSDLPPNWDETNRDDVPGQTFAHTTTGAIAAIYRDSGWTVDMTVAGDIADYTTRHTYFDEAVLSLTNAMKLHNALTGSATD